MVRIVKTGFTLGKLTSPLGDADMQGKDVSFLAIGIGLRHIGLREG